MSNFEVSTNRAKRDVYRAYATHRIRNMYEYEVDKKEVYAAISAQPALLGIVTPNLRAVTIKIDSQRKILKICFFHDKDISEAQFDIASTAITEISADFPEFELDDCIERLDFPSKVPVEGRLVFLRQEPL